MPGLRSDPVSAPRPVGREGAEGLFRHVMACLDRSPQAVRILEQAAALAALSGADLTALRVLPPGPATGPCADPVDWELARREEIADLRRTARIAGAAGGIDAIVACGPAAPCIEEEARRRDVDLLAIGSGAIGTPRHWRLGGTARHLSECFAGSLLVVPEEAAGEPRRDRRVVVPMDGSPPSEFALRYGAAIARSQGADLVVLHAVAGTGLAQDGGRGRNDAALWGELTKETERLTQERLRRLRRLLPVEGAGCRVRRLDGDEPRRALVNAIREERADLVVLSARGQGRDPDLPIGSTAEYLLARAVTPVLMIREAETDRHRTPDTAPRRPDAGRNGR